MPLVFAFRIVDCFCLFGPKVLFQVSLAILKINGEELLQATDDGMFINIMKNYFASLGDSAHPTSPDNRLRQITRFQELLVVAFREFGGIITDDTVLSERKRFRNEVVESIEAFSKRTVLRNLRTHRLDKVQLSAIYDVFQVAIYKDKEANVKRPRSPSLGMRYTDASDRPEIRINRSAFGFLLADIATWARDDHIVKNGFHERVVRTVAEHDMIDRLFFSWDLSQRGALSLQDIITGLDGVLFNDLMANIAWFFTLHDNDKDGHLTKDEVLQLSESLLFIFRSEIGDQYLAAVSRLLQNTFEYADSLAQDQDKEANGATHTRQRSGSLAENPRRPYLALPTFRMVVLADELLESFFETDLTASWKLETLVEETPVKSSFFGRLTSALVTDENKERLNRLADVVGKQLEIQTIEQKPAIGKMDAATAYSDPKSRETLLSPMARTPSATIASPLSAASMRSPVVMPRAPSPVDNRSRSSSSSSLSASAPAQLSRLPSILPDRPQFQIDQVGDDDDFEEVPSANQLDDIMNQVDDFLMANSSDHDEAGLSGAESQLTKDLLAEQGKDSFVCKLPTLGHIMNGLFTEDMLDPIEDAVAAFKRGEFLVVMDDLDRENEGDLVISAAAITTEQMAFLIKHTSGYVCICMTGQRLDELQIPPMTAQNTEAHRTAFMLTVDYNQGTTTGISAHDRASTSRRLADSTSKPSDFNRPGHMVPLRAVDGGVLARRGHTEASVDLCRLAGLPEAGVICELLKPDDPLGSMARRDDCWTFAKRHGFKLITIDQLEQYRRKRESV